MFQLKTERLIISKFTISDAYFIFSLLNTPTWLKYIGDKNIKDIRSAEDYLNSGPIKSYQENGFGFYKVSFPNGKPVGLCGLIKRPEIDFIEIGYAIMPKYEGHGYTIEAARAVMEFAREVLKVITLAGITTEKNIGSINILSKLGMEHVENIKLKPDGPEYMLFLTRVKEKKILV